MIPDGQARSGVTFIDLEFDISQKAGAPLGDIASSLVILHDLLRDLSTLAAYPSRVEFREIQVVGIEMRNPLKVKLSLLGIPKEAVKAFQEICRDVIRSRERGSQPAISTIGGPDNFDVTRLANINSALNLVLNADGQEGHITEKEVQRLYRHIAILQNAAVGLKRVAVNESVSG